MPERPRRCLPLLAVILAGCTPLQGAVSPSVAPVASATLMPVASASPSPTATTAPTPTPTPDPSVLALEATSCEGGVVLRWSPTSHPEFHHYTALRSPDREIEPDYPPIAPAVDWGDTYATDPFITSAVDASIIPSETEWHYRVMAYDVRNRVLAASDVRTARLLDPVDLGELRVEPMGASVELGWDPYAGASECFSDYRVVYSTGGPFRLLGVVSGQDASTYRTDALHAGTAYRLRIDAVRDTTLGSFVLGQTETVNYTVP
jgi:hypothetical protein